MNIGSANSFNTNKPEFSKMPLGQKKRRPFKPSNSFYLAAGFSTALKF
jgi:hypothetical protein